MYGCLVDPVPGTVVTVPGINATQGGPAQLSAVRPRATPSGRQPPTMLSPGGRHPLQHHAAGSALSRRLVGDQQRYGRSRHALDAGPKRLVGGRRQVAWYVTQAANTQAMMLARVDVAVGTCG